MCWFEYQKQRRTLTFDRRPGIQLFYLNPPQNALILAIDKTSHSSLGTGARLDPTAQRQGFDGF